ncbi:uncharacterized protein N7477_008830 [Penicillium maclennaniae]|uniref:uncharacterized protein n=1 Tax=Penicillium maclennaniae TaxID=1343394 RepID=UPI0025417FD1|nr:uncharacterized protein N7477_008830 [Penicillium maclennaniae]KAJ5666382.1 hypothetical protein N7477_008830 [Penicillium maclennaniae]
MESQTEGLDNQSERSPNKSIDPKKEYKSNQGKGRFRFKSSSSRDKDHSRSSHSSRSKRHHRSHSPRHSSRPSKRRHRDHSPCPKDESNPGISPSVAFRESLFDALGDDEGAAYWQSVYGQPIHTYAVPEVEGPDGELERMDDEEYAAYVRARMWERTREGMLEEQERLREERRRAKMNEQRGRGRDEERRAFEKAMEDRGAERKKRKVWEEAWKAYLASWEEIARVVKGSEASESKDASVKPLRNLLFWPVESGKRRDVNPGSVQDFMRHVPGGDLSATLKVERVRWHPDKMQHRYGALGIDEVVLRSVTEVFQIIDRMWNEERR